RQDRRERRRPVRGADEPAPVRASIGAVSMRPPRHQVVLLTEGPGSLPRRGRAVGEAAWNKGVNSPDFMTPAGSNLSLTVPEITGISVDLHQTRAAAADGTPAERQESKNRRQRIGCSRCRAIAPNQRASI